MTTCSSQQRLLRWTLVLVAVAAWRATVAVARPADFSGEPDDESSAELSAPAVVTVPVRMFADPDSAFGRALHGRLAAMSDHDLSVVETGLRAAAADAAAAVADEEMMMGDMPSADAAADSQQQTQPPSDNLLPTAQPFDDTLLATRESPDPEETEDRNKKLRLKGIQSQIINFMGWNARASESSPLTKLHPDSQVPITTAQQRNAVRLLYDNVNNFPSYPSDTYTEKTQSFYPVCDLPKHTNEDVWNAKESMNLMFNISLHKIPNGITVNVNTAKLRLFKQLVSCNSPSSNETTDDSPSCQPTLTEETMKRSNSNISVPTEISLIIEDRQIRVSVYAYTRSLKRKRVKRKLLDSRMMSYYIEKWTEWNIRSAVKIWRREPTRNHGLSIEVEDEDGNLLPVNRFFRPMNCTGDAQMMTPKPIPGILMEAVQQHGYKLSADAESGGSANASSSAAAMHVINFNLVHRYPMIDVTTVEVPDSEAHSAMVYQYAKHTFEHSLAFKTGQFRPDDLQNAEHRIRHNGNRHRTADALSAPDGDAGNARTTGVSKDGHEVRDQIMQGVSKDGHEIRDQIIMQGIVQMNPKTPPTETLAD